MKPICNGLLSVTVELQQNRPLVMHLKAKPFGDRWVCVCAYLRVCEYQPVKAEASRLESQKDDSLKRN